ncbi:AI-2E family transporter [Jeongeupia naejangsanensis]|uniref:AI-2E family transporter n=1 Tax=Jeongeupia naejangsanensis TaxID=613195 RepID=A0ABS2BMK0_9NEIS|nr:AI-2E family transporter [Jeongeupia naejangsanensis]MBM3116846.1 AI-2E family transporter [Jeongeupia naejangsanensis]
MFDPKKLGKLFSRQLLDVLIQAALIISMVVVCYRIFSPFLTLILWAMIMAVTLYPLHRKLAPKLGEGRASTAIVIGGFALIIVPVALLASSLADSVTGAVHAVQNNALHLPLPPERIAAWPLVGEKIYSVWHMAATDLPGLIHSMQPKIGDLSKSALGFVAGIGGDILKFVFALIIAGVMMAYGEAGAQSMAAIGRRLAGAEHGDGMVVLSTNTIRAVAQGVIGVALIQALIIGLVLMVAQVPFAGALAVVVLILGIAQLPVLLISLPVIAYIWMSGDYGTVMAVVYSILLVIGGMADNVLKPILLGRGVDAPMPVVLLGALGGMVAASILGMFVGAVLLSLGYIIFMRWVALQEPAEGESAEARPE